MSIPQIPLVLGRYFPCAFRLPYLFYLCAPCGVSSYGVMVSKSFHMSFPNKFSSLLYCRKGFPFSLQVMLYFICICCRCCQFGDQFSYVLSKGIYVSPPISDSATIFQYVTTCPLCFSLGDHSYIPFGGGVSRVSFRRKYILSMFSTKSVKFVEESFDQ